MNQLIEFTRTSFEQKQKLIEDIDVYLKQISDSCDTVASESSKEEFIYQSEKGEIVKFIMDLESEKQILWVKCFQRALDLGKIAGVAEENQRKSTRNRNDHGDCRRKEAREGRTGRDASDDSAGLSSVHVSFSNPFEPCI